mmetsp:Transcript_1904/g.4186  ORF Transcript_1904/g.4186 Transcript_1904/m.4186 type:complete len:105 (-) Transcript_1904:80-394(-)
MLAIDSEKGALDDETVLMRLRHSMERMLTMQPQERTTPQSSHSTSCGMEKLDTFANMRAEFETTEGRAPSASKSEETKSTRNDGGAPPLPENDFEGALQAAAKQ